MAPRRPGAPASGELLEVLERNFGYRSFQGTQEAAIKAALDGRDAFVLMPTGGGKTMCFTLPALVKPGVVLVVSPLIALMENQVAAIQGRGIACSMLSSVQSAAERTETMRRLQTSPPQLSLLFVTPELLSTDGFGTVLQGMYKADNLTLFAIDEAHCISSWGHDFRSAYRKLAVLRRRFPHVPIMALTATAAVKVREDVVQQLHLRDPLILVSSFDRPNIHYSVSYYAADQPQTFEAHAVSTIMRHFEDGREHSSQGDWPCGIIYCLKRETTEDMARALSKRGLPCEAYHAGLKDRSQTLTDWTSGKVPAVAATISFGMGIDKADVRLVIHFNLPKSIESFYQESGRAGRDGRPAQSVMLYSLKDRGFMDFILGRGKKRKRGKAANNAGEPNTAQAQRAFGEVENYCRRVRCRRQALLAHFGEKLAKDGCSGCDVCSDSAAVELQLARVAKEETQQAQDKATGRRWRDAANEPQNGDPYAGIALGYGADTGAAGSSEDDANGAGTGSGCYEDAMHEDAAAQAMHSAKKAGKGQQATLEAMEQAEKAQDQRKGKAPGRLRQLAEGGRMAAKTPPKPAKGISDGMRTAARERLYSVLKGGGAAEGIGDTAQGEAQRIEAELFRATASKPVYNSMLANALRSARSQADAQPSPHSHSPATTSTASPTATTDENTAYHSSAMSASCPDASSNFRASPVAAKVMSARDNSHVGPNHDTAAQSIDGRRQQQDQIDAAIMPLTDASAAAHRRAMPTAVRQSDFEDLVDQACKSCDGLSGMSVGSQAAAGDSKQSIHHNLPGSTLQSHQEDISGVHALRALAEWPVSIELLQHSQAGRRIRQLKRHHLMDISQAASEVVAAWKHRLVAMEASSADGS
ncbi:hypothetical protein WJX74_005167 [Apatococcus lobatus]|uniref:ATP-dependent DNA helicase n=1 Tax=Apatococcus lobatus TaxID=904363 RepID=A0AAW1RIH2_9CHLO